MFVHKVAQSTKPGQRQVIDLKENKDSDGTYIVHDA